MPSIKLSGGKVVLKSGKVSCSCCTPPSECCLYPWPGESDPRLYPYTDLPETILFIIPSGPDAGTYHGERQADCSYIFPDYTPDPGAKLVWTGSESWVYGDDGGYGGSPCLIQGFLEVQTEDEFADTYTGTYGVFPDVTLTRINTCEWTGEQEVEGNPYSYRVYYDFILYKWTVQIFVFDTEIGTWLKDDPQSSPEGDYDGIFLVGP